MATTKQTGSMESGYRPARELAARATSKHGNPADYAIVCSASVPSTADVVAARVHSAAFKLEDRSHQGDVTLQVGHPAGPPTRVVIDVSQAGEAILDRGGFSLRFAPQSVRDESPRFEGQIRIDHVDAASSRVVAEGRYIGRAASTSSGDGERRSDAEAMLRQIVTMLTAELQAG